jgi:hypothetical protein
VAHFRQIGQAGQFRLQLVQQFLTMRLLARGFQQIEADRIASPSLTLTDDDFLNLQILGDGAVTELVPISWTENRR